VRTSHNKNRYMTGRAGGEYHDVHEQSAHWYTEREMELIEEQDRQLILNSLSAHEREGKVEEWLEIDKARKKERKRLQRENEESGVKPDDPIKPRLLDEYIQTPEFLPNDNDKYSSIPLNQSKKDAPPASTIFRINSFNVCFRMFDGHDWDHIMDNKPTNVDTSHLHHNDPNVVQHDYVKSPGSGSDVEAKKQTINNQYKMQQTSQTVKRMTERVMELHMNSIYLTYTVSASSTSQQASRLALVIDVVEVHDCIMSSPFRKFMCRWKPSILTPYVIQSNAAELQQAQIRMELLSVRPDGSNRPDREEYRMRVSVAPLRIHADQDAVEFLIAYFKPSQTQTSTTAQPSQAETEATTASPDVTVIRGTDNTSAQSTASTSAAAKTDDGDGTYIQLLQTENPIRLCVDYAPKRFSIGGLSNGQYAELVNLFPLEHVEIELMALRCSGAAGWGQAGAYLLTQWVTDIFKHQAHKYIAGVQPIRSFVQVGSGVLDLLVLPVNAYRQLPYTSPSQKQSSAYGSMSSSSTAIQSQATSKRGAQRNDRRRHRHSHRGALSIMRSVASESVGVAAKIASGAKSILETVDDLVSVPSPSHHPHAPSVRSNNVHQTSNRHRQQRDAQHIHPVSQSQASTTSWSYPPPANLNEGLHQAYESLNRGMQEVTHHLMVVPREEYLRSGTKSAVRSVVRSLPSLAIKQMIGFTDAVSRTLTGVQYSVDPSHLNAAQHSDKYKRR